MHGHGHKDKKKGKHKKHGAKSKSKGCHKSGKKSGHHNEDGLVKSVLTKLGGSHKKKKNKRMSSESQVIGGVAYVDGELCEACGKCLKFCPEDAITVNRDGARIDTKLCAGCGACVDGCPEGAITLKSE